MSINVNLSFLNPTWLNWEDLQGTLGQHWSMNWFSRSHKSEKSFQQEGNNICVKFCTVLHVLSALVTFIIIRVDLRVNRDKTVWLTDWWLIFFLSITGFEGDVDQEQQELGQILSKRPGEDGNNTEVNEPGRVFPLQRLATRSVNLAIKLHFQPTSDEGTTALIIFSAAKSLGVHCKSQPDMRLSNYTCFSDGGLRVRVAVETSCRQSPTAGSVPTVAHVEKHTYAHTDLQTDTSTNGGLLTGRDACAALSNEPVIRPARGSQSKRDTGNKPMLIKL